MDLRQQILKEHSKAQTLKIVNWIGSDQSRFDKLFNLFLNDLPMVVQRAAWPLSYAVVAHPIFIKKHFKKLLHNLDKPGIHNAVRRNTVRLLDEVEIPSKYEGDIMNRCFDYLLDPKEMAAVKAHSLTILNKLSAKYPEIKTELITIIEENWEREGAAFRARAKRILRK